MSPAPLLFSGLAIPRRLLRSVLRDADRPAGDSRLGLPGAASGRSCRRRSGDSDARVRRSGREGQPREQAVARSASALMCTTVNARRSLSPDLTISRTTSRRAGALTAIFAAPHGAPGFPGATPRAASSAASRRARSRRRLYSSTGNSWRQTYRQEDSSHSRPHSRQTARSAATHTALGSAAATRTPTVCPHARGPAPPEHSEPRLGQTGASLATSTATEMDDTIRALLPCCCGDRLRPPLELHQ